MSAIPTTFFAAASPPSPPVTLMLSRTDLILPVAHSLLAHSKIASPIPTIKSDREPSAEPRPTALTPARATSAARSLRATSAPRSLRFASLARSVSSPLSDFSDDSRGAETTPVAQNALPVAGASAPASESSPPVTLIARPKGVQHSLKSIKTISTSRQKTIMERIAVLAPKMLNERSSFKEQNLQRYQAFETKMLEEFPVLKSSSRKRKDRVLKEVVIAAVQA
ncbi:hypothetical protein B0H14DRAFT_3526517 [Mycena olivaceomarginata]|nr:hypothetical protein B0H14DRAFT_3526517 [Mycena olivaceomarginata]